MQLSSSLRYVAWLDTIAMSYLVGVTIWQYSFGVLVTIPALYRADDIFTYVVHLIVVTFLAGSIFVNFYAVHRWNSFVDGSREVKGDWCSSCGHVRPSAAHHCSLCARCVMRRDHHCFATGICIGIRSHRHFFALCLHTTLVGCYALYTTSAYFSYAFPRAPIYARIFPVALYRFITGHDTALTLHASAACSIAALSAAVAVVIFTWQCRVIAAGTTMYTHWKGERNWGLGIAVNFRATLGHYWPLQFIMPMPWITIPGDASNGSIKYQTAHPD